MACKRSAVRSRLPPPKCRTERSKVTTLSSRGLGHHPFTVSTGVRIPVGSPRGVVVQLVRIPACHAGGRGFESRPLRQHSVLSSPTRTAKHLRKPLNTGLFCFLPSN